MDAKLTDKAEKLYTCIKKKGGGVLEEWWMRDQTGLSHGSFCAARKELVEAGLLKLGKEVRKTTYELLPLTSQGGHGEALTCQPSRKPQNEEAQVAVSGPPAVPSEDRQQMDGLAMETVQEPERKPAEQSGDFFFTPSMPHVAGNFFDFDEWTDALMNALGECLDISESLVEEGTYTVYSHDYESEDTYHTETTADGFIVN